MAEAATQTKSGRKRDAVRKLADRRLSVLEMTRELGNGKGACRRGAWTVAASKSGSGVFRPMDLRELRDLPPIHKSHPPPTSPETVWGTSKSWPYRLRLAAIAGEPASIVDYYPANDNRLGTGHARWLMLEKTNADVENATPSELLSARTLAA